MDKLVIATIQGDRMPEHYFFELLTCTNPLCACKNFVICFTQISDETGTTAMPLVEHRVAMDVSTLQPPKMSAHTASRFEKQFLTQLTRDDMNSLHWWHNKLKSKAIEKAVLSTLKAEFPLADIDNGITVAYMDVLPFVEHYNIMLANTSYELIDSYCVRSGCACTTVNFNFLHIDPVKSTGNILTIYLADYRRPRARWTEDRAFRTNDSPLPDIAVVQHAVETAYPGFYQQLERRHLRMKLLYAYCRKRHGLSNAEFTLPISRNDDCPCGSGQKYKKCCFPALR